MPKTIADISQLFKGPQDSYRELINNSGKVLELSADLPLEEAARELAGGSIDLVTLAGPSGELLGVADPKLIAVRGKGNLLDRVKNALQGITFDNKLQVLFGPPGIAISRRAKSFMFFGSTTAYECTQFSHIVFDDPCPKHGCPCKPLL